MIREIADAPYIARAMGTGNNTMWREREETANDCPKLLREKAMEKGVRRHGAKTND